MLGEEDAAVLISHLPPSGWSDVARTRDLDELEHRLTTRMEALEARMDARFEALAARFDASLHRELRRSTLLHLTITSLLVTLAVTLTQLAPP